MRWPINAGSANTVTVYAPHVADPEKVLIAVSALGTGDTFCATAPDDESGSLGSSDASGSSNDLLALDAEGDGAYSATISDTVATFLIDVTQDPLFGELPAALAWSGWNPASLTAYEISVAALGPGSDRLRYRLAKALLEVTGGVLVGADGAQIDVGSLADPTWGSLW